ncbi:hypothetical protein DPMN_069670 [Dreissena polymorpha]|uniref:Uncharacterized protein n=1 Tax=Dreissena polymorpha TaxID=45954 RepID=A0A9D3Z3Z7_DREPO|nr:hypothetical protein DPMN_069670 [Dreissena polymorpha]
MRLEWGDKPCLTIACDASSVLQGGFVTPVVRIKNEVVLVVAQLSTRPVVPACVVAAFRYAGQGCGRLSRRGRRSLHKVNICLEKKQVKYTKNQ